MGHYERYSYDHGRWAGWWHRQDHWWQGYGKYDRGGKPNWLQNTLWTFTPIPAIDGSKFIYTGVKNGIQNGDWTGTNLFGTKSNHWLDYTASGASIITLVVPSGYFATKNEIILSVKDYTLGIHSYSNSIGFYDGFKK